jgi:hypothetical protein
MEVLQMKEAILAAALTISGVVTVVFGFLLLPLAWPANVNASLSGASIAYYSIGYQPLSGAMSAIDSLTNAPSRPDLFAFRLLFLVVGLSFLVPGLLISKAVRE